MDRSSAYLDELDERGFVLIEDFISADLQRRLRQRIEALFADEGDAAGSEFRQEPGCGRLANLVDKGKVFRDVLGLTNWRPFVAHVLGEEYKLSSMNARLAYPQRTPRQPLHADMGAVADHRGYWVCNTVWLLDDFTTSNGAMRFVPGSHKWAKTPQSELSDPLAEHPREERIIAPAGSLVVMNAHLWHSGLANLSDASRLALHVFFCRRDKPQQQYQRALLSQATQSELTPDLRKLLALDDPLNDELSAAQSQQSGFLK